MMLELSDWIIIALYLIITLVIGLAFTKSSGKNLESYILGSRNLPWWVAGFSMVATTFAADTPLAVTELVAKNGISGNWLWWNMLTGGMLTVFFFATLWRRSGVLTEPELITLRYGGKPASFLRVFRSIYLGLFMNIMIMGWVNIAFMTLLEVFFGFSPEQQFFWTACVMIFTAFYTSLSGLLGVAYTDLVQFLIAMIGCIVLAVLVISSPEIGGMSGLTGKLPPETFDFFPNIGSVAEAGGMLTLSLGSFLVFAAFQWWASWYPGAEPGGGGYIAQRMMSTPDEKSAVYSILMFQVANYCLRPWPWILVGLATLVLYPDLPPADAKLGYVMAMRDFLPAGLRGLMLAAFLGAYMSTISTQLNWGAGYIVNDAFRKMNLTRSDEPRKEIWWSRLTVAILMALSLGVTTYIHSITQVWEFILQCGAGLGLVLILRWYWWRINVWSEVSATIAPFLIWPVLDIAGIADFPTRYIITVCVTTFCWVIITLMTKPESSVVLSAFYRKIRPGGFWKPVQQEFNLPPSIENTRAQLICWLSAVIFTYSVLFLSGNLILGFYDRIWPWLISACISLALLIWKIPGAISGNMVTHKDTSPEKA